MSRRASRSAARKANLNSRRRNRPAAKDSPNPQRSCPRPNKWFLSVSVLMLALWIGFLLAMALLVWSRYR